MLDNKLKGIEKTYLNQEGLKFLRMNVYKLISLIIEEPVIYQKAARFETT